MIKTSFCEKLKIIGKKLKKKKMGQNFTNIAQLALTNTT